MKVMVTGSNGQLGRALLNLKPDGLEVIPTDRNNFNLLDLKQCKEYILDNKPDWIINAAAYTAVDLAEEEQDKARIINGEAPTEIAKALKKTGGKLLHISTDFIFDGKSSNPYQVNDKPNPLSIYGRTKLLGENGIKDILLDDDNYIILRTSWVMGPVGKNFIFTMLKLHTIKDQISVVYDQIGCMTSTSSLAKICWLIVQKDLVKNEKNQKILHWTEAGASSWFDIATDIGEMALKINLLKKRAKVLPISTHEFPTKAKRPSYSLLDCSITKELLNIENNYWRNSLQEILQEIKLENHFEVS
ncbi:MAG: dTDP-4-dehydrorhamnose reductase [Candidatus Marinimicrobia bacterium]|nr:dTDP-4-dehydrorhamnose reductase [Candidatus Neomarinimicrobiota bacterium]|tara:strand:+ start:1564 stop:2472 length:909 start_codon:yes stop_codon:yes gene_type:complete